MTAVIGREDINACLSAWTAADLLQGRGGAHHATRRTGFRKRRVTKSVWSSIARRFGLLNK